MASNHASLTREDNVTNLHLIAQLLPYLAAIPFVLVVAYGLFKLFNR